MQTKILDNLPLDTGGKTVDLTPLGGTGVTIIPELPHRPITLPVNSGPQLLTPAFGAEATVPAVEAAQ